MNLTRELTHPRLWRRVAVAYSVYVVLTLVSFAFGYFLLPRGALANTPWTAAGAMAAGAKTPLRQFLTTLVFNLGFVLVLGVLLNLQRVRGFPTGYVFVFSAGILSGLIAGTNSFAAQTISPYTLEGWLVALRIQHLELLGYTVIVASTIAIGLREYTSWLPWKTKESGIQTWRHIRLTRQEWLGIAIGLAMLLLAAYNETLLGL